MHCAEHQKKIFLYKMDPGNLRNEKESHRFVIYHNMGVV